VEEKKYLLVKIIRLSYAGGTRRTNIVRSGKGDEWVRVGPYVAPSQKYFHAAAPG